VLCFSSGLAEELQASAPATVSVVSLPHQSPVADVFAAEQGTAYLLRPDMHIAARWLKATAHDVVDGFTAITAGYTAYKRQRD